MCVICASPKGVRQPTEKEITTMFENNPDGAGYMTVRDGKVIIHKGFMLLDDLLRQLRLEAFTAADPVVYHFRISTQAGVNPQMTHPFPMTRSVQALQALDVECSVGVAHNGIIPMTSNGDRRFSDTALFVGNYLPALIRSHKDLNDPRILRMIEELIHSKMAIMDNTGDIALIGPFVHEDGLEFSNRSFTAQPVKKVWRPEWEEWYNVG